MLFVIVMEYAQFELNLKVLSFKLSRDEMSLKIDQMYAFNANYFKILIFNCKIANLVLVWNNYGSSSL